MQTTATQRQKPIVSPEDRGISALVRVGQGFRNASRGLLRRVNLDRLMNKHNETVVASVFALICGTLGIGVMSLAAYLSHSPMIFASLGPTAFLFFYSPRSKSASPRNALMGHFIACAVGFAALNIFGIHETISYDSMKWGYIFTCAFSLGLTSAFMVLLNCPHPPAGSTTLIVALGFLHQVSQLSLLMLAVVMLTALSLLLNRLAGIRYPLWPR
jgi:CBS-domain-containing membrane protein